MANLCSAHSIHLLDRVNAAVCLAIVLKQAKFAHDGIGRAELHRRHLVGVLPVGHPCHSYVSAFRSVVECDGGVVVLAIVHPLSL